MILISLHVTIKSLTIRLSALTQATIVRQTGLQTRLQNDKIPLHSLAAKMRSVKQLITTKN